jgi:hypothetical protein
MQADNERAFDAALKDRAAQKALLELITKYTDPVRQCPPARRHKIRKRSAGRRATLRRKTHSP